MNYLVLSLTGTMQHWASRRESAVAISGAYYRTERCPTRPGLVGMIGAALGYQRGDERLEHMRRDLGLKYKVIRHGDSFWDYQTMRPLLSNEGFETVNGSERKPKDSTIIKHVEYLQGYKFEAYVGTNDDELHEIYNAFCNPVYNPYFGKKCCIPSDPIALRFQTIPDHVLEVRTDVHDCP